MEKKCKDCKHGYIHPMESCKYCPKTRKLINSNTPVCEEVEECQE